MSFPREELGRHHLSRTHSLMCHLVSAEGTSFADKHFFFFPPQSQLLQALFVRLVPR